MINVFHRERSTLFLNARSYIERVLGGTGKARSLSVELIPTVLEVLILFYFINMFSTAIANKRISVKQNYRSSNIIGLVVHRVCSVWTQLMQEVGNEALSVPLLHYVW